MRFAEADRYGGFAVGLIVISAGIRVVRETTMQLMDTMPAPRLIEQIREAAFAVPGVRGVEKCFARKTGFKYHVDLHLEVDPDMTVRQSHQLAHEVQLNILRAPGLGGRRPGPRRTGAIELVGQGLSLATTPLVAERCEDATRSPFCRRRRA